MLGTQLPSFLTSSEDSGNFPIQEGYQLAAPKAPFIRRDMAILDVGARPSGVIILARASDAMAKRYGSYSIIKFPGADEDDDRTLVHTNVNGQQIRRIHIFFPLGEVTLGNAYI